MKILYQKFYLFNSCVCNEQLGSFEDEQPDMFEQKNDKIVNQVFFSFYSFSPLNIEGSKSD